MRRAADSARVIGDGSRCHTAYTGGEEKCPDLSARSGYGVQAAASGTAVGPLAYVKVALPVHIPVHVDGLVIRE